MISYDAGDSRCRHCASLSTSFGTSRAPRSRPASSKISSSTLPASPTGVLAAACSRGTSQPPPTASRAPPPSAARRKRRRSIARVSSSRDMTASRVAEWVEWRIGSAEGEGVGPHTGIEEGDLEQAFAAAVGLAHELIQALAGDGTVAIGVGIHAVVGAGRLAVDGDAVADRLAVRRRAEHQVQVAAAEAIDDGAAGLLQLRVLVVHAPAAVEIGRAHV